MDDLIRRKEAIKALSHDEGCGHVCRNDIRRISSVEAMPLEPLCQWLAGYAAPPQYAMDHVYDMNILNGPSERYEAWKYHFRELLKSGLMDTEENNAENK